MFLTTSYILHFLLKKTGLLLNCYSSWVFFNSYTTTQNLQ